MGTNSDYFETKVNLGPSCLIRSTSDRERVTLLLFQQETQCVFSLADNGMAVAIAGSGIVLIRTESVRRLYERESYQDERQSY